MRMIYAVTAALCAAALPLAGCSQAEDPARTAESAQADLALADARMMLPPVSGNPAAIYFTATNNGSRDVVVRAVEIAGAERAELHGSMEMDGRMQMDSVGQIIVRSGTSETLEPGGYHIMAFDLDAALQAGGTTELTLTAVGGETMTFPVAIRAAGDDR